MNTKRKPVRKDGFYKIPLSQGQIALVDLDDIHLVEGYNWTAMKRPAGNFYAVRYQRTVNGRKTIYMHRAITHAPERQAVDHINHDTLDNRRANLRLATYQENAANNRPKNKLKGVRQRRDKWEGFIQINNKYHHLGTFRTEEEAARRYDKAAKDAFGAFARLNYPKENHEGL